MPGAAPYTPLTPVANHNTNGIEEGFKKARVLYDYDAKDATELSLMADEVCIMYLYEGFCVNLFYIADDFCL